MNRKIASLRDSMLLPCVLGRNSVISMRVGPDLEETEKKFDVSLRFMSFQVGGLFGRFDWRLDWNGVRPVALLLTLVLATLVSFYYFTCRLSHLHLPPSHHLSQLNISFSLIRHLITRDLVALIFHFNLPKVYTAAHRRP